MGINSYQLGSDESFDDTCDTSAAESGSSKRGISRRRTLLLAPIVGAGIILANQAGSATAANTQGRRKPECALDLIEVI